MVVLDEVEVCLHPILSWLLANALILGDIVSREAKALSPRTRMYLGIQYASSRSVRPPLESHLLKSFVVLVNRRVLSSFGHMRMCAAISLHQIRLD